MQHGLEWWWVHRALLPAENLQRVDQESPSLGGDDGESTVVEEIWWVSLPRTVHFITGFYEFLCCTWQLGVKHFQQRAPQNAFEDFEPSVRTQILQVHSGRVTIMGDAYGQRLRANNDSTLGCRSKPGSRVLPDDWLVGLYGLLSAPIADSPTGSVDSAVLMSIVPHPLLLPLQPMSPSNFVSQSATGAGITTWRRAVEVFKELGLLEELTAIMIKPPGSRHGTPFRRSVILEGGLRLGPAVFRAYESFPAVHSKLTYILLTVLQQPRISLSVLTASDPRTAEKMAESHSPETDTSKVRSCIDPVYGGREGSACNFMVGRIKFAVLR
ncbi:hypothetical protein F5I97DRAFT_1831857 [Phlebopus sp. FC_14]|nr:hypothetical protein F5I97DRAFT_1831857 [Phlebopus sp. FC_14]